MEAIKDLKSNELRYDNLNNSAKARFSINNSESIEIDYQDIINTQFTGGNVGEKFEELKNVLHLGIYSKAPCGGFVNFYEVKSNLNNRYILYSGVNEVSNSHYIVTIHKILAW